MIDPAPYCREDADELFASIRDIDRAEMVAMLGEATPESFHEMAMRGRRVTTGRHKGRLVVIFGCAFPTVLSQTGTPWMLGTRLIDEDRDVRRSMIRSSRPLFEATIGDARRLWNYVATENTVAIRWLEWLGFTMHRHMPLSVRGLEFIPFTMER